MLNDLDKEERINEWYPHNLIGISSRGTGGIKHSTLLRELMDKIDKCIGNNSPH